MTGRCIPTFTINWSHSCRWKYSSMVTTSWTPTSAKWSYTPYKWLKITGYLGWFHPTNRSLLTPLTPLKINMEPTTRPIEIRKIIWTKPSWHWGSIWIFGGYYNDRNGAHLAWHCCTFSQPRVLHRVDQSRCHPWWRPQRAHRWSSGFTFWWGSFQAFFANKMLGHVSNFW